ncbi:MFS transporter [Maribacter sp. PR1]|uniref:MFS transporter n=1 Tax=Maribacter cobaltidurans TaxID=1178778 RepID=A0ABU7IZS2_9FLAO|nr:MULTISPECIES: MFS transporter [Maribacter]MDC6391095.1 MFS transporter [Maribacter sp. PR1]MEE1978487.1 MFS transporter [Maribacter cobaltidurans]
MDPNSIEVMIEDKKAPWYYLALLILAGESVFILPFVLQRVFRPTFLKVFELNNVELGLCFSVYGFVALVSYLLGGPLADKFLPRKLIAIALWCTAAGGVIFATFPNYRSLQLLYGFWGFTTIFLFWSPMIKATRVWGGKKAQGRAFGFLDGGRGLVGALFGTLGVLVFSFFMTGDLDTASLADSRYAFRRVILVSSGIVAIVGMLVWFFMKLPGSLEKEITIEKITISQIGEVLRLPSVLLLMIIILCAYVGYKLTDDISLYAQDVMLYNEVDAAKTGTFLLFIRPVIGFSIGILADRSRPSLWLLISFIVAFSGSVLFATGLVVQTSTFVFLFSIFILAAGVYAARSLYFSVMQSGKIPLVLTGTAVGLISLIGYTPDIFAGPAMGYLLDNNPGMEGHRKVFYMLAGFSFVGVLAAYRYFKLYGIKKDGLT